ncbi:MAG TPA: YicC/YloC family endoribonuclease [Acidobacteriaceae bacterium]|nr:YicC/YloC family endoribonuclease [Acidobacteriaceae bacterium]
MNAPPVSLPIFSMTGFARVSGRVGELLGWTLTLKSVNHRYLDLHVRMPAGTESLEMRLRRRLKDKIVRGHLEVTLSLDRSTQAVAAFNRELLQSYLAAFHDAAAENGLEARPDLNILFRLPGVLSSDSRSSEEEMRTLEHEAEARIDALIDSLNAMRREEGEALAAQLGLSMRRLDATVVEAARLRHDVQKAYFERISERVSGLLTGIVDRDRLLQEAAVLADRSDVEEEVTRLHTHILHFHSLLAAGGEIGKKLDFLLQEMNREANTLLSKTGGVSGNGQRITELGLEMKTEIEKAREQVQNLE